MDCFNILSIIILVVLSLAIFKYPTELYLQARCDNESTKLRVFYYLIAIFYIIMGIYAMSEVAISIMILCLDIENPMRVLIYAIAFMVEVIGNFLYIKIRYGGISQLLENEIDYVCDKMPEIISRITAISPYQEELEALKALKH